MLTVSVSFFGGVSEWVINETASWSSANKAYKISIKLYPLDLPSHMPQESGDA